MSGLTTLNVFHSNDNEVTHVNYQQLQNTLKHYACACSLAYTLSAFKASFSCSPSITPLSLGGESLTWVQSIKYLGVHIVSARRLTFDINPIKRAFFVACNTICCQSSGMDEISDVVLETAVLVSRPLETVFWRSWSWSWY